MSRRKPISQRCHVLHCGDQTEWVETIETGWNQLVNSLKVDLSEKLSNLQIADPVDNLCDNWTAARNIVSTMQNYFE